MTTSAMVDPAARSKARTIIRPGGLALRQASGRQASERGPRISVMGKG